MPAIQPEAGEREVPEREVGEERADAERGEARAEVVEEGAREAAAPDARSDDEAVELRRKLYEIPIRDIRDVEAMATLDADARKKLETAELLADAFIGVVFAADVGAVETRIAADMPAN